MSAYDEIRREYSEALAEGGEDHDEIRLNMGAVRRLIEEHDAGQPTWLDEVASRVLACRFANPEMLGNLRDLAKWSYDAAEALLAEGRRRRGRQEARRC